MSNVFVYDIIRLQICSKFRLPLFLRFELFWVKQPVAIFTKMLNIRCLTRFWPCLCLLPQGFHSYQMFLEEEFSYWNIFWKYSLKFIVGYNFSKSIYVLLKKLKLYLPYSKTLSFNLIKYMSRELLKWKDWLKMRHFFQFNVCSLKLLVSSFFKGLAICYWILLNYFFKLILLSTKNNSFNHFNN